MAILSITEKTVATLREGKEPRILLVDLETSPILGWAWDGWETNLLEVEQDSRILCFSYKWLGDKKVRNVSIWQFKKTLNRFKLDDWPVVEKLWALFNEADVIVAQNGNRFDIKVANTRFLAHGIPPPSEHKDVDTLLIARRYFKMTFNSLDHLCRFLKIERKADPGSKKTWFDCMDGKPDAWKRMVFYNNRDVECLEGVYAKMKGWYKQHPNLSMFTRANAECPTCLSRVLKKDGCKFNRTGKYQAWVCNSCGTRAYTKLELLDKVETYK